MKWKFLRGAAWTLLAMVGVAVAFLLLVLAVNWTDRPPSADAIDLDRLVATREPVADERNAFVYLLGMSVPPGEDPAAWGARRAAWLNALTQEQAGPLALPGPEQSGWRSNSPTAYGRCQRPDRRCADGLRADAGRLDAWLASEGWRLQRYEGLLARSGWQEPLPPRVDAPLPAYGHALEAQRLFLIATWREAHAGNVGAVRERLDRDASFWRHALAESDLLITKMIATGALRRNFAYGRLAIRELDAANARAALPRAWLAPITPRERSMLRAMAGEWRASGAHMRRMQRAAAGDVRERLGRPLFQLQDSLNRSAAFAVRYGKASEAPYRQLLRELEGARHESGFGLYNPIGRILIDVAAPAYQDYASRVADIEGMRRAAVAAARLQAAGVDAAGVSEALAAMPASLRDPYSNTPLRWNARARTLGFQTLLGPARAQEYGILY